MKKLYIKVMLESLFRHYEKPDPISGLMYVLFWMFAPEKYYLLLWVAQYYCATDENEKEEMISILVNYRS